MGHMRWVNNMRQCLVCDFLYNPSEIKCNNCGNEIEIVNGVEIHVDETMSGGFDQGFFKQLAALESENFWFNARNDLIAKMLKSYVGDISKYLEIGCGTGFVLQRVAQEFNDTQIFASEFFAEGLSIAKERVPRARFIQMDGRKIPYSDEFNLVGLYDVLEHIDDDELVLSEIHKALAESGMLVMTVPQHKWLWSHADDYAHHQRRYTGSELKKKLTAAGFKIEVSSSFVTLLFPMLVLSRVFQRSRLKDKYDPVSEFSIPKWVNSLFYKLLSIEVWLIHKGVRFPFGGSRFIVATKGEK